MNNNEQKPILITNPKNISYITGSNFDGFWIIKYNNNIYAITSKMIKGQLVQFFKDIIEIFVAETTFSQEVINICQKYNFKEILIDTTDLNYQLFNLLSTKFKEANISVIPDNNIVANKRLIKKQKEIDNIDKACKIVSEVFEIVKKQILPGMTEEDIHFKIEEEFAKKHVIQSFKTIVASGPNAANPHHISSNRKIEKNDVILIDMGCIYKGYCSDLTRTFFIGNIQDEQKKVWDIVKQAHDEALQNVKEGMKASDIDNFARKIIEDNGYGDKFIHNTGHGVGIDIHEAPTLYQKSKDILKEGMIITIEPGIYIDNDFGVRTEDTVLVTKDGFKVLTNASY